MIEADNLFFSYTKQEPLLKGVSFSIKAKSWVAIFGPNGGGKTTLLRLLLGFLKPLSGKLLIDGKKPSLFRGKIGYVPQINRFDKSFPISVLEVVKMGGIRLKLSSKEENLRAEKMLSKVGLLSFSHKAFGSLSGGQAQRVLIARALMSAPQILLLDESTANIDLKTKEELYELLSLLKKEMTILMVTHDLAPLIHKVDTFLCVQTTVHHYLPSQLCNHFTLGLYHS